MGLRPGALLPRLAIAVVVVLLATATITFAAETRQAPATPATAESSAPTTLLVPDVRRQAYVFAKTTLEESGFAWRVSGGVAGYSANPVAAQSPAPGTLVLDTGAPTIVLTLSRGRYPQEGAPENASPYPGTEIRLPGTPVRPKAAPKKKVAPTKKVAPKKKIAPKKKTTPARKVKPKPAAKRPPAFNVPGAKSEPLIEMPLPARARALDAWLTTHRRPTDANVRHWLYQHAWVVAGARLGWWQGEEALELLLKADERVQRIWGIGSRSETVARAALAEVRRKSR
jgi:beta-lactam-binding protein with PASTA domain